MNENQTHQLGAQISCLVILLEILREPVGLMQLRFGSVYLCITESSLHRAVTLFFQAMGAVCCLYFLGSTTPMPQLIEALRRCHAPELVIELMYLIYRYLSVLLDEPTSSLDPENVARLEETLDRLTEEGIALPVCTHDVNFAARFARRGLVFSHGKLAADCEMERIFSNQDLLRQSGLRKPWVWQAAEAIQPGLEHYPVTVPQFRQWAERQNAYLFHEGRMKQDGTKETDL